MRAKTLRPFGVQPTARAEERHRRRVLSVSEDRPPSAQKTTEPEAAATNGHICKKLN